MRPSEKRSRVLTACFFFGDGILSSSLTSIASSPFPVCPFFFSSSSPFVILTFRQLEAPLHPRRKDFLTSPPFPTLCVVLLRDRARATSIVVRDLLDVPHRRCGFAIGFDGASSDDPCGNEDFGCDCVFVRDFAIVCVFPDRDCDFGIDFFYSFRVPFLSFPV